MTTLKYVIPKDGIIDVDTINGERLELVEGEQYECWKPESLSTDDFNLIILDLDGFPHVVRSSDFESPDV